MNQNIKKYPSPKRPIWERLDFRQLWHPQFIDRCLEMYDEAVSAEEKIAIFNNLPYLLRTKKGDDVAERILDWAPKEIGASMPEWDAYLDAVRYAVSAKPDVANRHSTGLFAIANRVKLEINTSNDPDSLIKRIQYIAMIGLGCDECQEKIIKLVNKPSVTGKDLQLVISRS